MKYKRLLLVLPVAAIATVVIAQGPLAPSGAPAPVMKSLDQIEPRTPISSLPYIINEKGSYYLTRNLHFTAASGDAIFINASYVTLDLMGFTISSSATVTGSAIRSWDGLREIEVRNGAILGGTDVYVSGAAPNQTWTVTAAGFSHGIQATSTPNPEPSSCHFSQLRISGCRSYGLKGGEQAVVEQVTATKNGTGIYISDSGSVTNCTASLNGGNGISASGGSVTNCVASFNEAAGIYGTSVANSRAIRNGGTGIISGGSVTNCAAEWNGNTGISGSNIAVANSMANNNGGTGIGSSGGSVTNCVASFNDGSGISGASVTNCNASTNGNHGISAPSGVVAFCKAAGNNTNNNGSVDISATGATRTGNNPAP